MRGVSLEEVSSATRISTKFLEAIENGHWNRLPGGAFNRGYIRSTSRYLGLDEDGMVAEYALETKSNGAVHIVPARPKNVPRNWKRVGAVMGVVLVAIAGGWFTAWSVTAWRRAHISTIHAATVVASNNVASKASEQNAGTLQLVIRALQSTDVRVIADGRTIFDRPIQANEQQTFDARSGFEISANDSAAVQVELNGQPLARIGPPGGPGRITLTAKDVKSSAGGIH